MDEKKKTVLILIDWFAPGYKAGGPIQSCVNVAFALKENYVVKVLTTDTDYGTPVPYAGIESDRWICNIDPAIQIFYAKKQRLTASRIKQHLLNTQNDYLYLNLLFSPLFVIYPLWLKWKGIIQSKVVICPRGSLYENALLIKKYKKVPYLKVLKWMGIHKMVRFHATNEREKRAIMKHFPGSEIFVADNFPNMIQPPFLDVKKEPGKLRCIFVARVHPIKNLHLLLQILNEVKSEVKLTIVGPVEDKEYWIKCKSAIGALPVNVSVQYNGPVPNQEIMYSLQENHLLVLPTSGENFGHSIFEALLAGRPVLISDQTPWHKLDELSIGWDLSLENKAGFAETIDLVASMDQETFSRKARSAWEYARNFINNPDLKRQYFQLFS
ncbi:MAG TPA: glycosyltransferase [Flavitalea sp.]|nr:glycosyltransferase [Flavitalea sp.]